MVVLEQIQLFTEEQFDQSPESNFKQGSSTKSIPQFEEKLLNKRIIPLLKAAKIGTAELRVCIREVFTHWMVVEVSTITASVTMTIMNNGDPDYIHWQSGPCTIEYENQYFNKRYNPSTVFYLEKRLEQCLNDFLSYKT
ncbi:hypothetical protein KQ41_06420 [Lysinibacillus fusiformis]|uniref:hypothetical protein n=1 Tax=Lysinibacillus fusiformis TaxID=28031 RepID=UPI000508170A|nr:hypothetical protein [Lysinibacillus fusiformis]KGA83673.1 hypothetical protein KQ41_06420 [Lysinibacillus fusiformis]